MRRERGSEVRLWIRRRACVRAQTSVDRACPGVAVTRGGRVPRPCAASHQPGGISGRRRRKACAGNTYICCSLLTKVIETIHRRHTLKTILFSCRSNTEVT